VGRRYVPTSPWKLTRTGAGALLTAADQAEHTPDATVVFSVEMRFTMSDWTPGAGAMLARQGFTDGNLGWSVEMQASGRPRAAFYPGGVLAAKIGVQGDAPAVPLVDGEDYGLRASLLGNFVAAGNAYSYALQRGSTWEPLGGGFLGGVIAPFDSTEGIVVGEAAEVTDLYSFRVTSPEGRRLLDAGVGRRPGNASWADTMTPAQVWTRGAGDFARSERPVPYAGR
jgi:hypothetical protein